ncbi:hypothetical protein OF83DRAFT_718660, partial [Amylostereum chailletii]
TTFKLLSVLRSAFTGCLLSWDGRSRQASENELVVSKTIYADCSSRWLKSEDAGSPGDTHIPLPSPTSFLHIIALQR